MRLAIIIKTLPFVLSPLFGCDKNVVLFPSQCNCDIEAIQLSETSLVTYQVLAHNEAAISSITYQTNEGQVTIANPAIPFTKTIELKKGEKLLLNVMGNPGAGSIVLTYEVAGTPPSQSPLSSTASKVWVLKDGHCQ